MVFFLVINYLEILLLDKFKKNDNIKRTILFFKKIMNQILIKWKKSNYNDYMNDITEFNNLLQAHNININFTQHINLSYITCPLYNIDDNIKLLFLDFFEKLITKYIKQDKIKDKLTKIKNNNLPIPIIIKQVNPINSKKIDKNLKENSNIPEHIESIVEIKIKKKKKPISSTIKKLVWNTNIGEEKGKSKCLCCKSTDISQMSFHCGHIIAESNGGETIVSNLKPICQNCNSSMGSKNMNDFMKSLK